ncbi:MAG: hypothetical protein II979_07970, partial [Clostridia bacterium]|nr:hypothetical protein [Clostridia bacterium]
MTEGGSPIEKNVRVTDMHGNEREPTWPKRAEGLVKKGRAYRLAEDHICLTGGITPDDRDRQSDHAENGILDRQTEVRSSDRERQVSEEYTMDAQERNNEIAETAQQTADWGKLNISYVLDRIEAVRRDTEYLQKTIEALDNMAVGQGPGDVAGEEKAKALADVVRCRETTNQKLLDLYAKMYEDLKPVQDKPTDNIRLKVLEMVDRIAMDGDPTNLEILLERVE